MQTMLSGDHAVLAETGDSWFNCLKLTLPEGCGYEFQMQYGSIGWYGFLGQALADGGSSVGSLLGALLWVCAIDTMTGCCVHMLPEPASQSKPFRFYARAWIRSASDIMP